MLGLEGGPELVRPSWALGPGQWAERRAGREDWSLGALQGGTDWGLGALQGGPAP